MADSSLPPQEKSGILQSLNAAPTAERTARNQQDWAAAEKLGITEESLEARHPEVAAAVNKAARQVSFVSKAAQWVSGVGAVLGAAVPLLMFKKSEGASKWAKRAGTALVTGAAGGVAGFVGSIAVTSKSLKKNLAELDTVQNAALEQEIGAAVVQASNPLPPLPVAVPKEFSAVVTARDTSHTAQAARDAAQSTQAAVGK